MKTILQDKDFLMLMSGADMIFLALAVAGKIPIGSPTAIGGFVATGIVLVALFDKLGGEER